jgi:hypothetical protein
MIADPRQPLKRQYEPDQDFLDALNRAVDESRAAEELLNSEMVSGLFETTLKQCFYEFCDLNEDANLKDFRAIHLKARGIIKLRDMLKHKISLKNEMLRQKEQDENLYNGRI